MFYMFGQLNKDTGRDKKINRFEAFGSGSLTYPHQAGNLRSILSI